MKKENYGAALRAMELSGFKQWEIKLKSKTRKKFVKVDVWTGSDWFVAQGTDLLAAVNAVIRKAKS